MNNVNPALRKRELVGASVIVLLGGFWHFVFELAGEWPPLVAVAPVNESVWEHLKLTFIPGLFWYAIAWRFVRSVSGNQLPARAAALFLMPAAILALFYAYSTPTGFENVIVDVFIFIIAVALGQYVSYRILVARPVPRWLIWLSVVAVIALLALYAVFTWYPPHLDLFRDSISGTYGLPR